MDAISTWIVPYVAEEIISVAPVPRIHEYRWIAMPAHVFEVFLGRITCNLLSDSYPVISRFIENIWNVCSDLEYCLASALSHGYPAALEYVRNASADVKNFRIRMALSHMRMHEKHWDYYVKISDAMYLESFTYKIYDVAVTNRYACLDDMPLSSALIYTVVQHYNKHREDRLRNIIARGLKSHFGSSMLEAIVTYSEFDDNVVEWMKTEHYKSVYMAALSAGRDDLAKRIEPYVDWS